MPQAYPAFLKSGKRTGNKPQENSSYIKKHI